MSDPNPSSQTAPLSTTPISAGVRAYERSALVVAFVYFFAVLAAYYAIRPLRDQFAASLGSTSLPMFYAFTFVAMLLLTPVYGALVARFSRRRFVPAVYGFFILCLLGFVPFFQQLGQISDKVLGTVFFVWLSVFNLYVVAVFWSFMADVFSSEQARRLFPTIAIGGTCGAVVGPKLTGSLVPHFGVWPMLVVAAGLLGLALICIVRLLAWSKRYPVPAEAHLYERPIGGGALAGFKQVLASPFLRRMAALMLLGDCIATFTYAMLSDYARLHFETREARTVFYGNLDFYANALTTLLQLTLSRWLMSRHSEGVTMATAAGLNFFIMIAMMVLGALMLPWAMVLTRAGMYGIFKPASDSLYTRLDREQRYKAKNFIDTTVWRFGDLSVTSLFSQLNAAGLGVSGFAMIMAAASVASGRLAWRSARLLLDRNSKANRVGSIP